MISVQQPHFPTRTQGIRVVTAPARGRRQISLQGPSSAPRMDGVVLQFQCAPGDIAAAMRIWKRP